MKIVEHENADHGWGYAIIDDTVLDTRPGRNIVVQFLNAHTEAKTDQLKNSTRALAEEEHRKLTDKKDKP
jgi:hypothetical protein